ncbi:MAG: HNH endonuclease [Methanothrix sp.]
MDLPWSQIRAHVLARDGNRCRKCESREDLRVHHIIQKALGGTDKFENLQTLCDECHRSHHRVNGVKHQPGERSRVLNNHTFITKALRGGKISIPSVVRNALKIDDGKQVEATVRLIEEDR